MRYELMLPYQIRQAIEENWPVVFPLGVLEYHGEHLAVGMDTLVVVRVVEILEQGMELVILPPFYYGAASYVVEPPEGKGTVHIEAQDLKTFAKGLFRSLLRIGFRNIHGIIHHQSENFAAGMPTDLAFKLAAREAIFEFLEKERGEGWWGDNSMADYFAEHEKGTAPFNWIQLHPLMDEQTQKNYSFDHAAIGETSLMMSLCPEGVDMSRLTEDKWYTRTAKDATAKYGEIAIRRILEHMGSLLNASRKK